MSHHQSAYRFCFGKPLPNVHDFSKKYYDFSEREISEFISKIIEKYDNHKFYFNRNKNVNFVSVSQLVQPSGLASSIEYGGENFGYLYRYMNVQNLRNMFSILSVNKIPITIHGRVYTVDYDNGEDPKPLATDEYTIDQSCFLKQLNSGEWKFCKDFLTFHAV